MTKSLMKAARRGVVPLLGAAIFFLVWEVGVRAFGVRSILLPAPSLIVEELAASPGWFAVQTAYTLGVTLAGFAVAVIFGVLFAVAIVEWKILDRLLFPLFVALNSVPKVALAPLFLIWFGTGAEPKIAIAFLIAVFAVVIDTALGLQSVSPDTIDLAKTLRGSRLKVLLRIKLYCALPHLFAGLKVAMSLALVGAIVGEFVSSQRGLGYVILTAQGTFDTPRVFAAIVVLAVLGVALIAVIEAIERVALPWHHTNSQRLK
ncbi:ABC transporter permease [Bradyrhizobium neotropicale]|uniref:ABC transporter permease n=1 Tax=Bradyrhizobium neotropicale TaxID=1497615 RepID=UPI001FED709A|nr:ABC transporter permease [Bradyrhizobium neotropicale]MBO4221761.1 ABC transporter permease subunit [Bradyrhizobium neotropicale]